MNNLKNSAYIPQIDGLRAIAVLSVILFHFQVKFFNGGYVGVDIFFVISGYLITGLLTKQISDGSGSLDLKAFYMRRIRRLFPALFAVVAVSFICAYLLFDPENMQRFSGAAISSLLSISNVYFFFESGYFDSNAYLKPLLHMWSLSVEEQFYLFWPLLLTIFWRKTIKFVFAATVISFVLCLYFIHSHPSATFFMMPFRIYEFGIGAALVWCNTTKNPTVVKELLGAIGFIAIAYSIVTFNEEIIFPGVNALIPCMGAALIIYSRESRIVKTTLGMRAMVHLGLLSYSLYLVHWPLVVFYKYYNHTTYEQLNLREILGLLIAAYILAWLLHRLVETRFRYASNPRGNFSFGAGLTLITLLLVAVSTSSWLQSGWPDRFTGIPEKLRAKLILPDESHEDYAYKNIRKISRPFEDNGKDQDKVLIIGDSQAGDFANMLIENGIDKQVDLKSLIIGAKCQPVLAQDNILEKEIPPKRREECRIQRDRYATSNKITQADTIILAANWRGWAVKELPATLSILKGKTDSRIFVLGLKKQGRNGIGLVTEHKQLEGIEALSAHYIDQPSLKNNAQLKRISHEYGYLDLMGIVCPAANYCHVLTTDNDIIFSDLSHLTPQGAKFLGALMLETGLLEEILENQNNEL